MKLNQDVRDHAASRKVLLWQCAEKLGIADTTFSKRLRRELPPEEKQKIILAINEIATSRRQ